nr:alpha-(1,6)-fucosyltransferase-like [Rhipicephalus microplus]
MEHPTGQSPVNPGLAARVSAHSPMMVPEGYCRPPHNQLHVGPRGGWKECINQPPMGLAQGRSHAFHDEESTVSQDRKCRDHDDVPLSRLGHEYLVPVPYVPPQGADDIHVERLARLESTIKRMREFLVRHIPRSSCPGMNKRVLAVLVKAREYLRVMEADVAAIRETDRAVRKSAEKMRRLRDYVRDTIEQLQNPADCKSAPKLRCLLDNPSGLAAGAHDVLWCFVAALQMGRTLILNSTPWHYTPNDSGWTEVLQPVAGPSCENAGSENMIVDGYPGHEWGLKTRRRMRDLPASFAKDLVANHGEPYAWWYGQILAYIFRLQNSTREFIEDFKIKNDYKHPMVALHIRRTDKKKEAAFHDVAEYMQHAEEFYSSLALRGQPVQKRVFIATDDPEVITEIIQKFPEYKVISNRLSALEAFDLKARFHNSTLTSVLIDIYLLAESDYLVCTFSSGFCRLAYELMQARYAETGADATPKAVSLDIEYCYAYVPFPPRRTLYYNKRVFHNELEWTAPGVLIRVDRRVHARI